MLETYVSRQHDPLQVVLFWCDMRPLSEYGCERPEQHVCGINVHHNNREFSTSWTERVANRLSFDSAGFREHTETVFQWPAWCREFLQECAPSCWIARCYQKFPRLPVSCHNIVMSRHSVRETGDRSLVKHALLGWAVNTWPRTTHLCVGELRAWKKWYFEAARSCLASSCVLRQNQQMPTLFESSEKRFNQSRLLQTIL